MLRSDEGEWRSLVGVIGHDRLAEHLDLVSNRIIDPELTTELRQLVKASLLGLLSEQTSLSHPTVLDLFRDVCEACDLGLSTLLKMAAGSRRQTAALREMVATRIKRITVKPFMDMNTMLEERLLQCCVHVGTKSTDQNQCAPFCAVQAWRPLGEMKLAEVARTGTTRTSIPVTVGS
jgi:hypothetical protein